MVLDLTCLCVLLVCVVWSLTNEDAPQGGASKPARIPLMTPLGQPPALRKGAQVRGQGGESLSAAPHAQASSWNPDLGAVF